ncbi:RDD family protein [Kibdelosporangium persicum]|uniref:RDD family membrane protein YckC n=1 Tax=Kibdelosporangium persicum TaxID=2698649 RepID=A0ABX2FF75_9PSEU|nr:RDD family protein [Kibdelosporangium persicum]NRN70030.1 putative RDD family membrane protein YckC [Kibdelosporangium persicum]
MSATADLVKSEMDTSRTVVGRRYLQYVIDQALVFAFAVLVFLACFGFMILAAEIGARGEVLLYLPFVVFALTVFAVNLWFGIWYPRAMGGATPAMRWLGLRIVTLEGGEPSVRDYFLRWLLMVVDGLFLGLLGAVLIAVTPRNQRLGDMVARTLVVRVT